MKIHELYEENIKPSIMTKIVNSAFFKINWKPVIDDAEDAQDAVESIRVIYHGGKLKTNTVSHIIYREASQDTPSVIHNTINEMSEDTLGVSIRSMLFGTQMSFIADEYGTVSIVIPIDDDYKIYYSTIVDDMYTSNKLFNFAEFRRDILSQNLDIYLYKDGDVRKILEKINHSLGGTLLPKVSFHIISYISENAHSNLGTLTRPSGYSSPSDFEDYKNKKIYDAAFKEVYSIFFSIYENKLSDIDDMDFHDTFNALIYEFTIKLCDFIIDQVRTWIMTDAKTYIESINDTRILTDIPKRTELLLPEGEYVTLGTMENEYQEETIDATLLSIVKHYLNSK